MYRNVYIGIPLPEDITKKYINLLNKLKKPAILPESEVESYENDIPHITLYFLGNQLEEGVEKIKESLLNIDIKIRNNEINIGGFGIFKKKERSIAYLRIRKTKELTALYKNLEENLKSFYFEKRAFIPHLTLSRKINSKNSKSIQMLKAETGKINWKFKLNTICLFGRDSKTRRIRTLERIYLHNTDIK